MNLLIVDDEELTRTGLISSIDWESLGIDQVFQADDGINGLDAARRYHPEIILCDVRMPRMDGIAMLERLEALLPDSVPIFMSGYSDKEYLKAAIRLKAVTYIEKPLNPREVKEAVTEAMELYRKNVRSHIGETLQSLETASRLALQLTTPYTPANRDVIGQLTGELALRLTPGTFFSAFIVKLEETAEHSPSLSSHIQQNFREFLRYYHLDCIHIDKRHQHFVYFLFGTTALTDAVLRSAADFLAEQYRPLGKYFIAAGDVCAGISRAYQSYASAVVLLQSSFFFPAGTFLTNRLLEQEPARPEDGFPESPEKDFSQALSTRNREACGAFLQTLFLHFNRNRSCLPNQAKDLFYKLLISLEEARRQQKLPAGAGENIVDTLEKCFSYQDLHQILTERTEAYFSDLESSVQENATIFLIKDYISRNYATETLSVKDISAHVFLSASYVCTFFKNETGQTLNQYLTEYRMERAKQLLCDPRYKIADISARVGYSDGNYFGKSFKKHTGLSPSEYRERMGS